MSAAPIRYYHRYQRTVETEQVYGERWLRWAYENPVGRGVVWLLARRLWFSKWYGWRMNQGARRGEQSMGVQLLHVILRAGDSSQRILPFIEKYNVDVDEFAKSAFDYKTFNEFFYRALKPGARPIAPGERVAVLPAPSGVSQPGRGRGVLCEGREVHAHGAFR
jgi:phosphatidylserine decarboxylase